MDFAGLLLTDVVEHAVRDVCAFMGGDYGATTRCSPTFAVDPHHNVVGVLAFGAENVGRPGCPARVEVNAGELTLQPGEVSGPSCDG